MADVSACPPTAAGVGALFFVAVPLAGALAAALLLPWIVGPGPGRALVGEPAVARCPASWPTRRLAGNTVVLAADGSLITYFYRNNRTPVAADQIAPVMKQALVDIEDSRFYEHHGLDVEGTAARPAAQRASPAR